jgi:hypothetical protein
MDVFSRSEDAFSEDVSSPFHVWCATCNILSSYTVSGRAQFKRSCHCVCTFAFPSHAAPSHLFRVMGGTGSGKTTFVNLISGSHLETGSSLKSCTSEVQISRPFHFEHCRVTLIDTPGFDDTDMSDTEVLRMIAAFLSATYALFLFKLLNFGSTGQLCHRYKRGEKLAGVIYFYRISDNRLGGISRRNFKLFRELCGVPSVRNVVIATNMWEDVNTEKGEAREQELAKEEKFFKPALDNGAKMHRHDNTLESAQAIVHQIIGNQSIPLLIQRELVDQGLSLLETAAGKELNRELTEQARKQREELHQIESEMLAAIKAKDEETRKVLEAEHKKIEAELERALNGSRKLEADFSKERAELERRLSEMEDIGRDHAQKQEGDYRERIRELEDRLRNEPPLEKEGIARQLGELYRGLRRITAGGFFSHIGRALDAIIGR